MTRIFESYDAFLHRANKLENGVSLKFAADNEKWEEMNDSNTGCWRCTDCTDCARCTRCADISSLKPHIEIPVIENIHQTILDAVNHSSALDMSTWHTCETTHCRAGWVVHLAGEKGKALEDSTSTLFAAMQIYHKSSQISVSPSRFYEDNKTALADMRRCAELEIANAEKS